MSIRSSLHSILRAAGIEVHRYRSRKPFEGELFAKYEVDAVFDIGANVGMSAEGFRAFGYGGLIVSFEPVKNLFSELAARAAADNQWHAEKLALGASPASSVIHVSGGHGGASSLLEMTSLVRDLAPDQAVTHSQPVTVSTVDLMSEKYYPTGDRLFLKLDVQGYEARVLEGARDTLSRVVGIRLELGLVESYRGELLLHEVLPSLYAQGFRAVAIDPAWIDSRTSELLQLNVTLFRVNRLANAK